MNDPIDPHVPTPKRSAASLRTGFSGLELFYRLAESDYAFQGMSLL